MTIALQGVEVKGEWDKAMDIQTGKYFKDRVDDAVDMVKRHQRPSKINIEGFDKWKDATQ